MVDGTEDVDAETSGLTVRPRSLPTPKLPSAEAVAHHNLTHFPYRSWCPYCCAGRRPNSHHLTRFVDAGRTLPMCHADDCFIRDNDDDRALTVLVGRMSPSRALLDTMCNTKGPQDMYALNRLENFLKDKEVSKTPDRSDQEPAIVALIEAALRNCRKAGTVTDAALEHSAVGESAPSLRNT